MAIIGNISEVRRQAAGTEALEKGLGFLTDLLNNKHPELSTRAANLKVDEKFEVPIVGKDVFAIFQAYNSRPRQEGAFEAHKQHTDIQVVLEGDEWIETCPLTDHGTTPVYDANNNFFFPLTEKPNTKLRMKPGVAVVLFPEDAHAPCLSTGDQRTLVRKVVVKVLNGGRPART